MKHYLDVVLDYRHSVDFLVRGSILFLVCGFALILHFPYYSLSFATFYIGLGLFTNRKMIREAMTVQKSHRM